MILFNVKFLTVHQCEWPTLTRNLGMLYYMCFFNISCWQNLCLFMVFTLWIKHNKFGTLANSVDPDEMAHDEPSHLDLHCLPFYSVCAYFVNPHKSLGTHNRIIIVKVPNTDTDSPFNFRATFSLKKTLHVYGFSNDVWALIGPIINV